MAEFSPFDGKRYEHDGDHVYYIPSSLFPQLESAVPTYLVGTRGTGKTTLLRALSWDERLYNRSLRAQLGSDPFAQRYIGLYFKLPNVQLELLDRWLSDTEDADYAAIVAFYLDLCWLETLRSALEHLFAQRTVRLAADAESGLAVGLTAIWRDNPKCAEVFGAPNDLDGFLSLMHPMRRAVEGLGRRRADPRVLLDSWPVGQVGSFGRRVGQLISNALDLSADRTHGPGWSFRVCMDEGEVLTLRHQRVINSMVRLAEWPVFYLVAYVSRPPDVTGTFLQNQTLQRADRQIILRDEMSDSEFRHLVEGVVNVRMRTLPGRRLSISTRRVLGRLDINGLLQQILRRSEGREMAALLDAARQAATDEEGPPPIYETYLRLRRPELSTPFPDTRFERRRQSSSSVRKQMVAAYLSICREAGAHPMYASADMVLQTSDKCVRDYLWQMQAIQASAGMDILEFLAASVPIDVQDQGLRDAAAGKMSLFRERVLSSPTEANQFVDGLARITALIQSTGRNYEQLRSPERGIFTYRCGVDSPFGPVHERFIREAAEAGFLRVLDDETAVDEIRFRVHASLAPHYGFSYRGAYYSAGTLTDQEIVALRSASTVAAMQRAVNTVVQRVTGRRPRKSTAGQLHLDTQGGS